MSRGSRQYPVDLVSGHGLAAALDGCAVVVDAGNASAPRRAAQVLVQRRQLLAAAQQAGATHHVGISIVGCELVPMGYYRVKAEQEQVISHGPIPWSIVAATQFHEFAAMALAAAAKWRVLPIPSMRLQTIAAAELAGTWRSITGHRALTVPVHVPGKLGRALRAGALTTQQADIVGVQPFAEWLSRQVASDRARPHQSA